MLSEMNVERPVIYALPRGGVPVAVEIARDLGAPLDLIFVRKIGLPNAPEVALGAVVDGENPQMVVNEDIRRRLRVDHAYLDHARREQLAELERRRASYLGDRATIDPEGRTAIIVDDGIATGATMKAALIAIRQRGAGRVCVALPVAPIEVLEDIRAQVDSVVCLHPAERFHGVGGFYDDFHQLTDEETVGLLRQVWKGDA